METIKNYLEAMFAGMPNTAEVRKAKAELLQMMEDKYSELIAEGKKSGLDVACETAPHYLVFSKKDIENRIAELGSASGGRFKMNPPIRTEQDKEALLQAVADGTVDMIATDHAPHSSEEKSGGGEDTRQGGSDRRHVILS